MKKFIPLLCALVCALPALAQDKAADTPKEFGFNFNFKYSDETRAISANVGFQREIAGGKSVVFDETVAGKNGILESETLSFVTEAGAVLGTLSSSFDGNSHLKSQSLVEGAAPPRALNWFTTDTKSPLLTVQNSALTATYKLQKGFLQQRTLNVKSPLGSSEITTNYDAQGRREHDVISGPKGKHDFFYIYDKDGLSAVRGNSGPNEKPFEIALTRTKDGNLAQFTTKSDGILALRTSSFYDEKGKSVGTKTENFENGILSSVFSTKEKSIITEGYKEGVLASRKTMILGDKNALQSITNEEFDADGKLTKRTDYNTDGTASAVTTYNADGSVKSTKKFGESK